MIQWFPGHMHLTHKAIAARVKDIDVVIELLDARLPGSSANPLLAQLTAARPTLKVLNKQDLADPARTVAWLDWYNARPATRAIALDASVAAPARALIDAAQALAPQRGGLAKPLRVLICGVPNVGKSTLINTLVGRRVAKTGDEAGITRMEQRILLADDFYLYDTPGMLWPRIAIAHSGYFLAASGAIGRNAYDEEMVALELLAVLRQDYAALLAARFGLGDSADMATRTEDALLADIGRKRGALQAGGRVNLQKAAEVVIGEFRAGTIGRITLETPERFAAWAEAARLADIERERRRIERAARRKSGRGPHRDDADDLGD